jgi:uncharacterized protein DUF6829
MAVNSTTYSTQLFEQSVGRIEASAGIEWVKQSVFNYPEISWLADENVKKTEEGRASLQGAYSEQLYGKKFIEFDRTLMTLRCLHLILDGSDKAYEEFTAAQPSHEKLSKESFQKLHRQGQELISLKKAIEAALVLGDMGKSGKAREIFKSYGVDVPDHDDFYEEAMDILRRHPALCSTFEKLSGENQHLLIRAANLAHFGHITHLEGGPNMFSKLKEKTPNPLELSFAFFVHSCDVAGALGHVNNQSSLAYTENTYQNLNALFEVCQNHPEKSQQELYESYLSIRAQRLGLNPSVRTERVLIRLCAQLRVSTKENVEVLRRAFAQLTPEQQEKIIAEFDLLHGQELKRTPTYVPALLINLGLEQAVVLGLPFIADVLKQHKRDLAEGKANPDVPLNFNLAAGVAKTGPQRLKGGFKIESDGSVNVS